LIMLSIHLTKMYNVHLLIMRLDISSLGMKNKI